MMQILLKDIRSLRGVPLERPGWVDKKRWNSIQKLKSQADKKRSLTTAYLLDYMCRDLGIDAPVYGYSEKGKPFLVDADCAFNISHSGDYVALVYHMGKEPVGADIQQARKMRDGTERRLLHEKEKSFLPEDVDGRLQYLNRLWAVKESLVKMTGEGLSCDFRTVYVNDKEGIVIKEDGMQAHFGVWEWKEDYYLAVSTMSCEECNIKEL